MNTALKKTEPTPKTDAAAKAKPNVAPKQPIKAKTPEAKPSPKQPVKAEKPKTAAQPKTPDTNQADKSKPAEAKKPAEQPKVKKKGVSDRIIEMLNREDGATDAELVEAFSWKGPHVARGWRATRNKKFREQKLNKKIVGFTRKDGKTAYKIDTIEDQPEAGKNA